MNFDNLNWDSSSTSLSWLKGLPNMEIEKHEQDLDVILDRNEEYNFDDHRQDLEVFWDSVNTGGGRSKRKDGGDEGVRPIAILKGHSNDVTCVDFAGRSLLATSSSDKTIRIYKWQPGDKFTEVPYSPLEGHRYAINCIAFSPFGTKLASASTDGVTIIWDVKTGNRLCGLESTSDAAIRFCAFSQNSSFLATGGDDDHAVVWDVSTLSLLRNTKASSEGMMRRIGNHDSTVTSISFTPDSNYLATGCSGGEIRLWDALYGHSVPLTVKPEAHDLGVSAIHFSPTVGKDENQVLGKQYLLASGGQDTEVHLWIVDVGRPILRSKNDGRSFNINIYNSLCGHTSSIMSVKFNINGQILASASGDKTVRLWDPLKATPLAVLEGHKRYVTSCAFSDDGVLLAAGSGDRNTLIWNVENVLKAKIPNSAVPGYRPPRFPHVRLRENKKLVDWNGEDVCSWLADQGLAEYAPNFRVHAIDGRELIATSDFNLEHKLGVDALGHRNKILRLIQKYKKESDLTNDKLSDVTPVEFLCPITQELIIDPVLCADGFTYERVAMEAWFANGKSTSPMTNEILSHKMLTPNRSLRTLIQKYREDNS